MKHFRLFCIVVIIIMFYSFEWIRKKNHMIEIIRWIPFDLIAFFSNLPMNFCENRHRIKGPFFRNKITGNNFKTYLNRMLPTCAEWATRMKIGFLFDLFIRMDCFDTSYFQFHIPYLIKIKLEQICQIFGVFCFVLQISQPEISARDTRWTDSSDWMWFISQKL